MRKPESVSDRRVSLVLIVLLLFFFSPGAMRGAERAEPERGARPEVPDLWFVELTLPPGADGTALSRLRGEKASFRSAAAREGVRFSERFAFDTLWNGLSVRVEPTELTKLRLLPGVKALYPVHTLTRPEPNPLETEPSPQLSTALAMTGADLVQSQLGITGAGVRVGIIDTGIDYDHPDLGGCFGPDCRVEVGWDFAGDGFAPVPMPDADPDDDCGPPVGGHGTHVAGIVGANGQLRGVAPGVTLGAYKIWNCGDFGTEDLVIAAMERALDDGMDVINMSFGFGIGTWPQDPVASAADRLVNSGVVVVAAAGNEAEYGPLSLISPAVAEKVIAAASVDNRYADFPHFEVAGRKIAYVPMVESPAPPSSGSAEIVHVGRACNGDPLLGDVAGKVALARRGDCLLRDKASNALAAGATAVVIYNLGSGLFEGFVGFPPFPVPVVGIAAEDGALLRELGLPAELEWGGIVPYPRGGRLSIFSSIGLAPDLSLEPDLSAPGGYITSTYPLELGEYATLSGTSMASPYVAGAAALLLEARPHTPAQAVARIFQNHADPVPWWFDAETGSVDVVARQGAGLIDIDDAILSEVTIEPSELALGEGEAGVQWRRLVIENDGASPVTFDLTHQPALSTGDGAYPPEMEYKPAVSYSSSHAQVAFTAPSLTVPAGGSASVDVTIMPPGAPELGQYGGYLVFTPQGGGEPLRVPYAGIVGDYQKLHVLDPESGYPEVTGLPWLVKYRGGYFYNRPQGATYSLIGDDIPWIFFDLAEPSRRVRMEVLDADTGRSWDRIFQADYVGKIGYSGLPWNGITVSGHKARQVADGRYVIVLSVLKALGDDTEPEHTETWTSPVITIDRSGLPPAPAIDADLMATLGDPAPRGGSLVNDFELGDWNANGDGVFAADLSSGGELVLRANGTTLSEIVRPGDPSPGGGTFGSYILEWSAINDTGQAAFSFLVGPFGFPFGLNGGVFRQSAGGVLEELVTPGVTVAADGSLLQGALGADIDGDGNVVFEGIVPSIAFLFPAASGVYRASSPGVVEAIASPGLLPPPGTSPLEPVILYATRPATNSGGDLTYYAAYVCPELPADCALGVVHLLPRGATEPLAVARIGDAVPGHPGLSFSWLGAQLISDLTEVLFLGEDAQGQGLYLGTPGDVRAVVQTGDDLPGGGHVWIPGTFDVSDDGGDGGADVAFIADLDPPGRGIYLERDGELELVARTGTTVRGVGTIATIDEPLDMALAGDGSVYFAADLQDGRTVLLRTKP